MSLCYQWPIRPEIHQGAHGGERVDRNTSGLGLCQLTDVTGDPERWSWDCLKFCFRSLLGLSDLKYCWFCLAMICQFHVNNWVYSLMNEGIFEFTQGISVLGLKCLEKTEIYCFTVLEDRCLKQRSQQGHTLSEALSAPGGPRHSLCYRNITLNSASAFIWQSLCLCVSFLLIIRPSVIGLGSTLIKYGLILTWLYLHRLYFQKGHILKFVVVMNFWRHCLTNHTLLRGTIWF